MKAFCNVREEAYKPNKSYIMMPIVTQSDFITTPQHQVLSHFSLPVPLASPGLVLLDFVVYILPDPERVHGQIYLTRVTWLNRVSLGVQWVVVHNPSIPRVSPFRFDVVVFSIGIDYSLVRAETGNFTFLLKVPVLHLSPYQILLQED